MSRMNTLLINKIKQLYKEEVTVDEFISQLSESEKKDIRYMINAYVKINYSDFIEILNDRKREDELDDEDYELTEAQELELVTELTEMSHKADLMSDNEIFDVLEKYDFTQRMFLIEVVFVLLQNDIMLLDED